MVKVLFEIITFENLAIQAFYLIIKNEMQLDRKLHANECIEVVLIFACDTKISAIPCGSQRCKIQIYSSHLSWKTYMHMQYYGVNEKIVYWVRDLLSDRKQRVIIDESSSDTIAVTSGVLQGSVIGPLLFIIYINDLHSRVGSKIRLFADDTVIYREIMYDTESDALSSDLNNVHSCFQEWGLELNHRKCTTYT
jgi:hypothetical protein